MISQPLRSVETVTRPNFVVPALACDTHMHVFGPESHYRSIPEPKYTIPEASLNQYLRLADRLGIERIVFVQPSFYGTDNACMLDAMRKIPGRSRGVVFLPDRPAPALLDQLASLGVRGIRLDLFKLHLAGTPLPAIKLQVNAAAEIAKDLGWHLEFYSPGVITRQTLNFLAALNVDFSVNHLGYMTREEGLDDDDFRQFLSMASSQRCWVKLTGTYRVGSDDRTDWMARELIATMPDRLIWGSDWPHIPGCDRDTGELLNRLAQWCPDDSTRRKILVDNPAQLYQFTDGT